jgi:DNA primase
VSRRFSHDLLRSLRNDVPINDVIRLHCDLPSKEREGHLRFLCPRCGEFNTATNARTNLARCFRCAINFNAIEIVMEAEDCGFVDAVKFLLPHLERRRQTL